MALKELQSGLFTQLLNTDVPLETTRVSAQPLCLQIYPGFVGEK